MLTANSLWLLLQHLLGLIPRTVVNVRHNAFVDHPKIWVYYDTVRPRLSVIGVGEKGWQILIHQDSHFVQLAAWDSMSLQHFLIMFQLKHAVTLHRTRAIFKRYLIMQTLDQAAFTSISLEDANLTFSKQGI